MVLVTAINIVYNTSKSNNNKHSLRLNRSSLICLSSALLLFVMFMRILNSADSADSEVVATPNICIRHVLRATKLHSSRVARRRAASLAFNVFYTYMYIYIFACTYICTYIHINVLYSDALSSRLYTHCLHFAAY